jgi:hypothetical protein
MERVVATYPIDIEPEQIVRWLLAEQEATPSLFRFDARVVREVRDIPPRSEYHLGDEEREDLSEVDTIATLEIRPANLSDRWALTISVEHEAGPRAANQPVNTSSEQKIDLGGLYHHFIRSGRGLATAKAEIQDSAGEQHMKKLIDTILVDRHPVTTTAGHHA